MAGPARGWAVAEVERRCGDLGDSRALRAGLLAEIGRTVAFDAYAWLLTDPETEVGSDPLADVPCLPELPHLIRLKYASRTNRWTRLDPVGLLHADTGGHPEESLVWRELLADYRVSDVASLVFRDRYGCWGFLDLWRIGSGRPFTAGDARYLGGVAPAVTAALRGCQARTFGAAPAVELPPGPVVLVLSPELDVRAQTAETDAYLRELIPAAGDQRPVPAGAYNVGAQLLARESSVDDHPARARVHLRRGGWLSMAAARMGGSPAVPGDIAVTIETAAPALRMDLFCRAHGLSPREADVLAALATGSDTRRLAAALYLSQLTVQDHLKSIFDKTGTRTRRVLLARALGG